MRMDSITADVADALRFPGSPANSNSALRTLRRMLNKAKEWRLIREVAEFKLFKEEGRSLRLDDDAERKLLPVAVQPLKDVIGLMRDTGMRNVRELYRMRVENIDWTSRLSAYRIKAHGTLTAHQNSHGNSHFWPPLRNRMLKFAEVHE